MTSARPAPVLVTGLPRSGTTWLARELTRAHGDALAGREPMNPRGRQFALGGTLTGWTRLQEVTPQQRRTLRRVYQGLEPRVYSRYGVRQWSAALPATRVVVKDPFALLAIPVVAEVTGAVPVVLFRHPAALMQSYRRMGWTPKIEEFQRLGLESPDVPPPGPAGDRDDVAAMAWFWSACYSTVLDDLADVPQAVVVDHAELAKGGDAALLTLVAACGVAEGGLASTPGTALADRLRGGRARGPKPALHNFSRSATDVTEGWRGTLSPEDAARMEQLTGRTWSALRSRRLDLHTRTTDPAMPGRDG